MRQEIKTAKITENCQHLSTLSASCSRNTDDRSTASEADESLGYLSISSIISGLSTDDRSADGERSGKYENSSGKNPVNNKQNGEVRGQQSVSMVFTGGPNGG